MVIKLLSWLKILSGPQLEYINFASSNQIEYADVTKKLPLRDKSVEVIYSSHMFEHLDQREALIFLGEAKRVLIPGGVLRLSVPCIKKLVESYLKNGDANLFISSSLLCIPRPKSFLEKVKYFMIGSRHHMWMYDGESLVKLLLSVGFTQPKVVMPGESLIKRPEALNLFDKSNSSVYVEAIR